MDEDESQIDKFFKKMRNDPSVPIGIVGCIGVVIYGFYNLKNKKMKLSLYLINLRIAAQGTVIGCVSLGLLYTICKNNLSKLFPAAEKKN